MGSEAKLKKFEERENFHKQEREILFQRMYRLADSRKKCIAEIKAKLGKAEERKSFPSCWYGIKCRRLFCKFNHKHVFNKVKESYKEPTNQAKN